LRAPRNFLLSPEIAGNPIRIPRLAPVFGWASAVASLLLVIVLVGDFFTDGGFAPVDLISSQQFEFISQENEISENDVWVQPAISEDMSVSSKSVVDSEDEAAPMEMRAEAAPMDTGADEPTMESVAMEEDAVVELQESEPLTMQDAAVAEEPVPENPEEIVVAAGEGESTRELLPETLVESGEEGPDEPQEADEVGVQSSVDLTDETAVTDQVEIEVVEESPTETAEKEEIFVQEMVEELEEPTVPSAEAVVIADEKIYQEEQLTSDDTISIDPMAADTITEEPVPGTVTAPKNESNLILGAEVILAMGALGTGLAWIYTRRRAG
jgi:hypothetical protein